MKGKLVEIAAVAGLALVAVGLFWQWEVVSGLWADEGGDDKGRGGASGVKVITRPLEITSNDRVFEAVGTGRARLSAEIHPNISDNVIEVNFNSGDRVEKGALLVRLDDREEQLAVRLAEIRFRDADELLERYKRVIAQGGVSGRQVEAAKAEREAAQIQLAQARFALEEHRIKAPFAGLVGIPSVDPGDRVDPSTMITSLDDRDELYVEFEVPEALAGELLGNPGDKQTIEASTPAYPARTFPGDLVALQSRLDPERRTLLVRASIDNEDDLLRPGMSFSIRWLVDGDDLPTIPEISLQWSRDGSYVWVVRDGKAVRVPVRVVARTAGRILVEGDIKPGEGVVIEGVQRLRPNADVVVLGGES